MRRLPLMSAVHVGFYLLTITQFMQIHHFHIDVYERMGDLHDSVAKRAHGCPMARESDAGGRRIPIPIYFLHIAKAGGTSIAQVLRESVRHNKNFTLRTWLDVDKHFDWSFIVMQGGVVQKTLEVVSFVRDPISRAVSEFYYGQTLPWTRNSPMRKWTLEQFLHNESTMATDRQVVMDGEGLAWWFCGAFHSGGWIRTGRDTELKRVVRTDRRKCASKAIDNLRQTMWFGVMERIQDSMALLQVALRLPTVPVMRHANARAHPKPSRASIEALQRLIPMDVYVYDAALRLFDQRLLREAPERFSPFAAAPAIDFLQPNEW
jgi:hypothetical protein